ncbi:MAG TPA: hypothetical protein VK759_00990, partial [Rhizomicrobium sp.]|nr:hypothetical protein [Rhizomicrobium sp.]
MPKSNLFISAILGGCFLVCAMTGAFARNFSIPAGDLGNALAIYTTQSGVALIVSDDVVKGVNTKG